METDLVDSIFQDPYDYLEPLPIKLVEDCGEKEHSPPKGISQP